MESPFVGDSGMVRRMRDVAWAGTPLGPPDGWPAALRSTVELMLGSTLPMYVAWGPRWGLLYNDAYVPLLGARHPAALGAEFATVWPEGWPALRSTFEEVLAGRAVVTEDRLTLLGCHGRPEEGHFTRSLGAVGGGAGVFCVYTGTTGRVVGERRLRALARLGALPAASGVEAACAAAVDVLAAHRADLPAVLLYLIDDDRTTARLVAHAGVDAGGALAPATVAGLGPGGSGPGGSGPGGSGPGGSGPGGSGPEGSGSSPGGSGPGDAGPGAGDRWRAAFARVHRSGRSEVVRGLADPVPGGRPPGPELPRRPLVGPHGPLPVDTAVVVPVAIGGGRAGLLVAAVSPYLPLDGGYRAFLDLVGQHVAAAAGRAADDGWRDNAALQSGSVEEALWWLPDGTRSDGSRSDAGHVLIADDDPDMRGLLARLLSRTYRVETVADGSAALAAALADPPDLVLADVLVPGLGWPALVRALRADPRTALVPVVLMSARAGPEVALEGLGAGADDHLVKPFSARELRARVQGRVALGRARHEAERRFRAMADSTPALIWADGPDGHRLFVNRGWVEFTGAGPDTDLGLAWRERMHPDDRERYLAARAGAGGGPFEVEYRLRAADGRHRWVLDRGAPVEGDRGGYVGGCLDVDARVRDRERQRLLAVVGAALDRETTVPGRRTTLVRTLVDEGLVEMARLVEVENGAVTGEHVIAARTPEKEAELEALEIDWMRAQEAVAAGGVRQFTFDEAFVPASTPDEHQRTLRRRAGFRSVVLLPLAARGHASGLLAVARTAESDAFDDADVALLVELGNRAGTALDNALLLVREQAGRARLELLQRATAALSAAATPEQVAHAAAEQFALLARATAVTFWRLSPGKDGSTNGALEAVGPGAADIPLDPPAAAAEAARSGAPVWADPQRPTAPDCIPLIAAGACVGVVGLTGHPRDLRSDAGGAALTVLAKLCAQALARAGLLAAERAARHTAEELGEVVGALAGATTPTAVAEVVLDHVVRLGATAAAVLLRRADHLEVLATRGDAPLDKRLPVRASSPAALAARSGEPVWRGDGPQIAVPLVLGGPTRPLGVLALWVSEPAFAAATERAAVLTLAGQCAQALDRARLHQAEHDVADVLQRSLLPSALPALPRLAVAARYLPSAVGVAAGGDWYDLLPIDGTRVALVVGDVVGHGAPAAAVMGQLRSALAAYLLDGHSPAAALERLDRFARRVPGASGSTCVCLVIDYATGELCWARAGHPPVLLLEPAGPRYLDDGGGTVLGVSGRPPYPQARAVIEPGSSVLLYTDGLVERRGEVVDEGQERLARAAAEVRDLAPDAVVAALIDAALGDADQPDDVALVAVRLVPEPLTGRLPAQPRQLRVMRRAVEEWAAAVGLADDVLDDLQYALGEAAANAVEHAYVDGADGEFRFTLTPLPGVDGGHGGVAVEVADQGRWRPVPADPGYRGRGVQVLHAVGRDVRIDGGGDGTTVRFRVPVPQPPDPLAPAPRRTRRADRAAEETATVTTVPGAVPPAVRVVGDLDLAGVTAVRPALLAAMAPGELVVDLCDTGYVSSAGVALLVELAAAARHHGTALAVRVAPGSPSARVLEMTGLAAVLPVDVAG